MLILKEGHVCQFASTCKYNNPVGLSGLCQGANSARQTEFTCQYVIDGKIVEDQGIRIPADKTGKMKIIME